MQESIRQTCQEMLEQRGYVYMEDDTVTKIVEKHGINNFILRLNQFSLERILVFLPILIKFNTDALIKYTTIMKETEINNCIGIYADSVTPKAKEDIKKLSSSFKVELFSYKELLFNITKHILQPSFEKVIYENEIEDIKQKCGQNLPILKKTDAIVRFYNFSRGDIIKITRRNGIIIYRQVK